MMIQKFLFNDLKSLSTQTAILEAADWDESVASRISSVINQTKPSSNIEEAKKRLRENLEKEKFSEKIIAAIFILIDIEESRMKTRPKI